jgi:hypothetical protein
MRIEDLARLAAVRPNGERSWMARCPAHDDRNPSLSVSEGDGGRVLFNCFAGCAAEAVAAALGLKMADLMGDGGTPNSEHRTLNAERRTQNSERGTRKGGKKERQPFSLAGLRPGGIWRLRGRPKEFVERYDYHTEDGSVLFTKLRFRDTETLAKTFIQLTPAPDGSPRWLFGRASNGVDEVLYHLPEVVRAASAGGEVWIAEGEKDVDALRRLGLVATCNADGAGKWRGELADALKGCARVTIIADNDPGEAEAKRRSPGTREWWQGQRHATDIADSLEARGIPWRAFTLPDAGGFACKDAAEWLAATAKGDITDENAADLRARIEAAADAAPPWPADTFRRPSREEPSASTDSKQDGGNAAKTRRTARAARAQKEDAAGGMPLSAGGQPPAAGAPPAPDTEDAGNVGGGEDDPRRSPTCARG